MVKRVLRAAVFVVSISCFVSTSTYAFFDFFSTEGIKTLAESGRRVEMAFNAGSPEARKEQLKGLEAQLKTIRAEEETAVKVLEALKKKIEDELADSRDRVKKRDTDISEIIGKRISVLSDREQNVEASIAAWKSLDDCIISNISLISESIERLSGEQSEAPATYSLNDLSGAEKRLETASDSLKSAFSKREALSKQKDSETEKITAIKKDLELALKEDEQSLKKIKAGGEEAEEDEPSKKASEEQQKLSTEKILHTKEKIQLADLRKRLITIETDYVDNQIDIERERAAFWRMNISEIRKRLVVHKGDKDDAFAEFSDAEAKAIVAKEEIAPEEAKNRSARDGLAKKLEELNGVLRGIKAESGEDDPEGYLTKLKMKHTSHSMGVLDKERAFMELKRSIVDVELLVEKLKRDAVAIRYDLQQKGIDFSNRIDGLKNDKNKLDTEIRATGSKLDEATSALSAFNQDLELLKKEKEGFVESGGKIFGNKTPKHKEANSLFTSIEESIRKKIVSVQEYIALFPDLTQKQDMLATRYDSFVRELELRRVEVDLWARSPRAISLLSLSRAAIESEDFLLRVLFWGTYRVFSPSHLVQAFGGATIPFLFGLLLFLFLFFLSYFSIYALLRDFLLPYLRYLVSVQHGRVGFLWGNIVSSVVEFVCERFYIIFPWMFLATHFIFEVQYFGFSVSMGEPYLEAAFYLVSIPILCYLSAHLLVVLKSLNQRLSFFFFAEKTQGKFLLLATSLFYTGSVILPLRAAFLSYGARYTNVPSVLLAAYSLIFIIAVLLCVSKDDILNLIPPSNKFFIFLRSKIDDYYYPVFVFLMGLFILSNPYVGYGHLSWYLLFVVPISFFVIIGAFALHHNLRKWVLVFFMEETDDDLTNRFEHAKMYYGFFVVTTFIGLCLLAFGIIAKIWGFAFNLTMLWSNLSDEWVLRLGPNQKLGVVEVFSFCGYLLGGYVFSSLVHRFILNKIYDIFRTEPGAQNTITRIFHYVILVVFVFVGFIAINLSQVVWPLAVSILLGVAFGLRDQLSDLFAGILILLERQIEIGHFIETPEVRGTVHKISVRSTIVRTARNFFVVIPNRDLISKIITNWGAGRFSVGFELSVAADYRSDPDKVIDIIRRVLLDHQLVLRVPAPAIRLEEFAESGVTYFVRAFVGIRRVREQWEVASDIRIALHKEFAANGVIFPYPQRVLHAANSIKEPLMKFKFDAGANEQQPAE
ncbi:mechanosensitive ion channel [bacterium]|nr:mechanosensitive ion channel [bacterium]